MSKNNYTWTSEQMIDSASSWSLAGDVALLNRLKNLSEYLIKETVTTSTNVDKLLRDLDVVHFKLDLTRNEFHSLRNTQFIENRVYEDDETLESEDIRIENTESSEEKDNIIKNSILKGLNTINNCFDRVEVAVSDSEDDETGTSYILQPKDIYVDRPLPYLIGSEEWYKKWHVGLVPSESESESDTKPDSYSPSLSDDEEISKDKGSETSSELRFSDNGNNAPVAHSTFNDTQNLTYSSEEGSLSSKLESSNEKFARQLAARLDNISTNNSTIDNGNINNVRSIQQPTIYGNLFSEEPPPLSDDEQFKNNIADKSSQKENLWPKKPDNQLPKNQNISNIYRENTKTKGNLFDESSSSEEDISAVVNKRTTASKTSYLSSQKVTVPLVDDEPPELSSHSVEDTSKKKKPVGGISIFGNQDLNLPKALKKSVLFDELSKENDVTDNKDIKTQKNTQKKLNLFENDNENDEEDDILSKRSQESNKNLSLFGENDKKMADVETTKRKTYKKLSLFDDDDEDDNEDEIFSTISAKKEPQSSESAPIKTELQKTRKNISLFDDSDDSDTLFAGGSEKLPENTEKNVLNASSEPRFFEKIEKENSQEENTNQGGTESNEPLKSRKNINLFDSDDSNSSDDENIFDLKRPVKKNPEKIGESTKKDALECFEEPPQDKVDFNTDIMGEGNDIVRPTMSENDTYSEGKSSNGNGEIARTDEGKTGGNFIHDPPSISLFDSSPPPVNWGDNRSDNSAENSDDADTYSINDAILDRITSGSQSERRSQSLFDNEPPSLDIDVNYSSGIVVKDCEDVTRVEGDDSSFYPYASSSRRFSSDLFREQQGQDSFQITKNITAENSMKIQPILENNAEKHDNSTKIDCFTPSGTLGDFEDDEDSIFFEKSNRDESKGTPGKLKHNLNINVAALLPNASRPKVNFATPRKIDTLENESHENKEDLDVVDNTGVLVSVTKNRAKIPVKRRPSTRRARHEAVRKSMIETENYFTDNSSPVTVDTRDDSVIDNKLKEKSLLDDEKNKDFPTKGSESSNLQEGSDIRHLLQQETTPEYIKPPVFNPDNSSSSDEDFFNKAMTRSKTQSFPDKNEPSAIKIAKQASDSEKTKDFPTKDHIIGRQPNLQEGSDIRQTGDVTIDTHHSLQQEKTPEYIKPPVFNPDNSSSSDEDFFTKAMTRSKTQSFPDKNEPSAVKIAKQASDSEKTKDFPTKDHIIGRQPNLQKGSDIRQAGDVTIDTHRSLQQEKTPEYIKPAVFNPDNSSSSDEDFFTKAMTRSNTQSFPDKNEPSAIKIAKQASDYGKTKYFPTEDDVVGRQPNLQQGSDIRQASDVTIDTRHSLQQDIQPESIKPPVFSETISSSSSSNDEDFFTNVLANKNTTKSLAGKSEPSSVIKTAKQASSLFSDQSGSDYSDSELFGPKTKASTAKNQIDKKAKETTKKNSIFDDSDDNDSSDGSLFGGTKSSRETAKFDEKKAAKLNPRAKIGKPSNIRKLENKEVTDFDPLSDLH
ncbi:WASH complex subunit 2 [Sitophilus oryzae]|uniref:WASH complex subunit 2 n=1 Tax=Sitophilus oryzae TaxID=7048 RepID=A0A6J2Y287_SITOR|nr:WASH complex subunit 2 [Sitophilus oryzae]